MSMMQGGNAGAASRGRGTCGELGQGLSFETVFLPKGANKLRDTQTVNKQVKSQTEMDCEPTAPGTVGNTLKIQAILDQPSRVFFSSFPSSLPSFHK